MKKLSLLVVVALAFGAGCRKKKGSESVSGAYSETETTHKAKSLFVDDIEGFVLEDESDPFSGEGLKKGSGVTLVAAEEEWTAPAAQNIYAFKTIYFDFDQYALRPDQKSTLDYDVAQIKTATQKGHTVVIEGHSCKFAGSAAYNMMLSEKRAKAVADNLIKNGVPADKLKIVGRGNEMVVVAGGDKDAQAPNRRVEMYLLK